MSNLKALKLKADELGIKYSPNISETTLQKRIDEALALVDTPVQEENVEDTSMTSKPKVVTEAERNKQIIAEATKLVRVQITPLDRMKTNYEGEIFAVSNSIIPTIKRYIPFGVVTHVENILLDVIKSKEMLTFYDERIDGKTIRKTRKSRAYGVEVFPQLTKKELADLGKAQQARNSI